MVPVRSSRRVHLALVALVVVLVTGAVACGGSKGATSGADTSRTASGKAVYHDGDSISVHAGDTFVIVLDANPSTGYSWTAVANPQATFVSSRSVTPQGAMVGAGGTQELTFTAGAKGSSTLTVNYARSFDPAGTPPAKVATFPITVE
ncbi:MAG: protease inhibitor I42 family protein [Actinomycetes bacterium]